MLNDGGWEGGFKESEGFWKSKQLPKINITLRERTKPVVQSPTIFIL